MMSMYHTNVVRRLGLGLAVSVLLGCGAPQEDDLDQFIKTAGADLRGKVEPLPEVKPYAPHEFNAEGTLNDPFKPRKVVAESRPKGIQPDRTRPPEPLEGSPLSSLKYVGSLFKGKLKYALVKSPDGTVNQVTIGNYLGQDLGMVVDITDAEIKLKEMVQDELTGDWVERAASVALQEESGSAK